MLVPCFLFPSLLRALALTFTTTLAAQTVPPGRAPDPDPNRTPPAPRASLAEEDRLQVAPAESVNHSLRRLAGQPVQGPNGERLGVIRDFILDRKTGEILYAVVTSSPSGPASETLRLVPINALHPAPSGRNGYVVKVDRVSWEHARPVPAGALADGKLPVPGSEPLTPTGRDDPAAATRAVPDVMQSAARSARQALDQEPALARAPIQVIVEHDRLVLQGRVPSKQVRALAEDTVARAASGVRRENRLVVEETRSPPP